MSDLSLKQLLKDCKYVIQVKDNERLLDICKVILRKDPFNYVAHVYMGFGYMELGDRTNSLEMYKKAHRIDPTATLALYGLEKFYLICTDNDSKSKLLRIYKEILKHETNVNKLKAICEKATSLASELNELESMAVFFKDECIDKALIVDSNAIVIYLWFSIATLLCKLPTVPECLAEMFEKSLKESVTDPHYATFDLYQKFLKILYKNDKYEDLLEHAFKMSQMFENRVVPLEWTLKAYTEVLVSESNSDFLDKFRNDIIDKIQPKLTEINPNSVQLLFFNAVMKFQQNNYLDARNDLEKILENKTEWIFPWYLILECHNQLYCFDQAAKIAAKIRNITFKVNKDLNKKLTLASIIAMTRTENAKLLNYGINLCSKVLDENEYSLTDLDTFYTSYANGLILTGEFNKIDAVLTRISDEDKRSVLKVKMLRYQGDYDTALVNVDKLLNNNNQCNEFWLECGLIYWNLNGLDSALIPFLKAAKYNTNSYVSFYYLGQIYELRNEMDKAKRCYQKAVSLNPYSTAIGIALSRVYRHLKNWDQNLALLQLYTVERKSYLFEDNEDVDLLWAWRQLGLHYLDKKDLAVAIDNFHKILRINPKDSDTLESLADAYLERGSYTSALKSYELAAQITQKSIYPFLQIGFIKLELHEFEYAYTYFKFVLDRDSKYVPALKGISEACLKQAQFEFDQQMLGKAHQKVQEAINFILRALSINSDFQCLWKIAADCCLFTTNFSEKFATLTLTKTQQGDENLFLEKKDLYDWAIKFYINAINLNNKNIDLLHDLAVCFFKYGNYWKIRNNSSNGANSFFDKSLKVIKFCVKKNPLVSVYWNFLGIVAASNRMKEYALAQHAFIKAIELNQHSAVAWSNLGVLYLTLNDIKLANEAFSRAQCADPNFKNCWIGQAFIAELLKHKECMDLFRHSTQLGFHPESAVGYAMTVCKKLQTLSKDTVDYSIHNMCAVQVACDNLAWYSELHLENLIAWNMLGILNEHQNNYKRALFCYETAKSLINCETDTNEIDSVLVNCARINCILKNYGKAISCYREVKDIDSYIDGYNLDSDSFPNDLAHLDLYVGYGYAQFMSGHYECAYKIYESLLKWFFEVVDHNEGVKSEICITLAAISYRMENYEDVETLLFQSIGFKPSAIQGLYASCAFGLLTDNSELSNLVIEELEKVAVYGQETINYPVLTAYTELLNKNDASTCLNTLISGFYRHHYSSKLLVSIAIICYQINTEKLLRFAITCVLVAFDTDRNSIDLGFCCRLVAQIYLQLDNGVMALTYAQKAIIYEPDCKENWQNLIEVVQGQSAVTDNNQSRLLGVIESFLKFKHE